MLELAARLSDRGLEIDVELAVTGDAPVPVAFGFHPYLTLPGLDRREWLVELPVTSRMVLDERMLPTGESEPVRIPPAPLGERTFDDAFDGFADPAEFAVAGAGRRVGVRFLVGYRFAQVYAPPGASFISFEPMTAPINPFEDSRTLLAQPGSTYRARYEIADLEGVDDETARDHARAVFSVLRGVIGEKEYRDVVAQLPDDYAVLVGPPP